MLYETIIWILFNSYVGFGSLVKLCYSLKYFEKRKHDLLLDAHAQAQVTYAVVKREVDKFEVVHGLINEISINIAAGAVWHCASFDLEIDMITA